MIAPPPRALKWLIWTLITLTLLAVIGAGVGVYAFREWVPPRYQVRIIDQIPIAEVFLPQRPADAVLPTPIPAEGSVPLEDLLGISGAETESSIPKTPVPTAEGDAEAVVIAVEPTATNATTYQRPDSHRKRRPCEHSGQCDCVNHSSPPGKRSELRISVCAPDVE